MKDNNNNEKNFHCFQLKLQGQEQPMIIKK